MNGAVPRVPRAAPVTARQVRDSELRDCTISRLHDNTEQMTPPSLCRGGVTQIALPIIWTNVVTEVA